MISNSSAPSPFIATAAVNDAGVVCYMKAPGGEITAEYIIISNEEVKKAQANDDKSVMRELRPWQRSKNISWKPCDPNSNLAVYTVGYTAMIFHQSDGKLCYWMHEPFSSESSCTHPDRIELPPASDSSMDPRPGTHLAVTGDSEAAAVTLFYQDKEGHICYRHDNLISQNWSEPARLQLAAPGTGIAAVSWNENENIRVFYQDENFAVKDYNCSCDVWFQGNATFPEASGLTDIAAVLWVNQETRHTEFRVYFQAQSSYIQEKRWTWGKGWHGSDTAIMDAFSPSATVLAFSRGDASDPVVSVWIASQDSPILLQKEFTEKTKWMGLLGHVLPRSQIGI